MFASYLLILTLFSHFAFADSTATRADLESLRNLECFKENPLIKDADDLTLIAIVPRVVYLRLNPRTEPSFNFTRLFRGTFVRSDLEMHEAESLDLPTVARVHLRGRGRGLVAGREFVRARFMGEVERLRARYPGIELRCAYEMDAFLAAMACGQAMTGS